MTVISDVCLDVARILSKWMKHQIIKLSHMTFISKGMNYELLLYFKLTRVDVGNVSKNSKNMKGIITWSIFTWWFLTKLCL